MGKLLFIAPAAFWSFCLLGNPSDPVAIEGECGFTRFDHLLEVDAQDRAIIDWGSFSIEAHETTRFIQPSPTACVLNRVTGSFASQIDGTLLANGRVVLVNPHGIIIGEHGVIQAADFIASTYDLVNKEDWSFHTDKLSIEQLNGSGVINMQGVIRAEGIRQENGQVILFADSVHVEGVIEAPSGTVEILGNQLVLEKQAHVDVSGPFRGGTILCGGDFQNQNGAIGSAKTTLVHEAVLSADAQIKGDGGKIVLWGDEKVFFSGYACSCGGKEGGNGGLIEVSSPQDWIYQGKANLTAENGKFGTLFFDPGNVTIDAFGASNPAFVPPTYNPPIPPGELDITELNTALSMGSVTILTTAGMFGVGNVTLVAGNTISWAAMTDLTITADNTLSIQGGINSTGGGRVFLNSAANTVIGNAGNSTPVSIVANADIDIHAGNGMFIIGGDGTGGTVLIQTTAITADLLLQVDNGDLAVSSVSGDQIRIGDFTVDTGLVDIRVLNGNFTSLTDDSEFIISSLDSIAISVSDSWTASMQGTMMGEGFRIECASMTGNPSFINVGSDITMQAMENANCEVQYQNSFLTLNAGRDMTLFSSSAVNGQWQPLGIGGIFNIGRDFLIQTVGTGDFGVGSNINFEINTVNNLTIQNTNSASAFIIANGILTAHVGQDLFIENTFSPPDFPGAAIAGVMGIDITANGNVELGNQGNLVVLNGFVQVIADHDIIMGSNSAIRAFMGQITSVTLVVDNQAPTSPLIGDGAFLMDPTASINSTGAPFAPVQIFTARQSQNSIAGLINNASFIPGPLNVDTDTERWRTYFPNPFVSAPFTIFYKEPQISADVISASNQSIAGSFDLLTETGFPVSYYEDMFCISYEGQDFAKPLFRKSVERKERFCPWIEIENYRKFYPSLQRWGYLSPVL